MNYDDVIDLSRSLSMAVAERAQDNDAERRLSDETIRDAEPLFSMCVPKSLGGAGLGLAAITQSTRIIGQGCPSAAWSVSFLVLHAWLMSRFGDEAKAEFFDGRPYALAATPLAPTGTLTPVDDGYLVKGRWSWATGLPHSDWVMVSGMEAGTDAARRFAVLPVADVKAHEVWFTSGMRATGTDDVEIDDVFVPAHRTILALKLMTPAEPGSDDPMGAIPVSPVLSTTASAPALGAAEAAVEHYRERVLERVLAYSAGEKAAEQPAAQMRLATAIADVAALRARWDRNIDDVVRSDSSLTEQQRAMTRLVAAATVRGARKVIGDVCEGSGASVYFDSHPLQRLQRDVEVLKGHVVFDWDRTTELAGRVALGMPLRPTDLA